MDKETNSGVNNKIIVVRGYGSVRGLYVKKRPCWPKVSGESWWEWNQGTQDPLFRRLWDTFL